MTRTSFAEVWLGVAVAAGVHGLRGPAITQPAPSAATRTVIYAPSVDVLPANAGMIRRDGAPAVTPFRPD